MRQIVLDTETTGLSASDGHRIIEIGCVELNDRNFTGRTYHQYINPERAVDAGALEVHGLDDDFLSDKPVFSEIAEEFLDFVRGAELIIHNAPFDLGFLDAELARLEPSPGRVADHCEILDSLDMAREMHPGMRNSLDALCRRYEIDNTGRTLHGALLDSELLADVYLAMTGGQTALSLAWQEEQDADGGVRRVDLSSLSLARRQPTAEEAQAHEALLDRMAEQTGQQPLYRAEKEPAPSDV